MAKKKPTEDVARQVLHQVAQEVDAARLQAALTPERIALAYRRVFSGEDGEIVLADLKSKFNGTTVRLRQTGIDPYETHFKEGQRSLYLALCEAMEPPTPVTHNEETEN